MRRETLSHVAVGSRRGLVGAGEFDALVGNDGADFGIGPRVPKSWHSAGHRLAAVAVPITLLQQPAVGTETDPVDLVVASGERGEDVAERRSDAALPAAAVTGGAPIVGEQVAPLTDQLAALGPTTRRAE